MTAAEDPGRSGRRANGLPASDWGALVDLDPRLSEGLLERLAEAGVAAYVEPATTVDTVHRAVVMPGRPLDRLWVDPSRADAARQVVSSEVAELTALLAEDDPAADASGLVQPVPRTAARRVLAPPALPSPRVRGAHERPAGDRLPPDRVSDDLTGAHAAGDADQGAADRPADRPADRGPADRAPSERLADDRLEEDRLADDEVFARLVADFHRDDVGDGGQAHPWPDAEDLPPPAPAPPAGDTPPRPAAGPPLRRRRTDPPPEPEPVEPLPAWVEPEAVEDDGHYVPPPPPPVPRVRLRTVLAVLCALLGVVVLFAPSLVRLGPGIGVRLLGMALLAGGAGALVWWMRDSDADSGPDDGAVV